MAITGPAAPTTHNSAATAAVKPATTGFRFAHRQVLAMRLMGAIEWARHSNGGGAQRPTLRQFETLLRFFLHALECDGFQIAGHRAVELSRARGSSLMTWWMSIRELPRNGSSPVSSSNKMTPSE